MAQIKVEESLFGYLKTGEEIKKFTLSDADGFQVSLIDYGATIQSIRQADRENRFVETTLGYDTLEDYVNDRHFFGCTVGRVTNPIKNARFELDGQWYQLEKNDQGKHHLHGVFHQRRWISSIEDQQTVRFRYFSPDGEDGYPGDLEISVTYRLESDHRLILDYHGEAKSKATPINLTNHSYFNLSGDMNEPIFDHLLQVHGQRFAPLDAEHIPTGEIVEVERTANDFRRMRPIGNAPNGFNVMFVIDGHGYRPFCTLVHPRSARALTIASTQNALQFYSGFYLNQVRGRNQTIYAPSTGLCLETQNFTDSVNNQPRFPRTILRPGEIYHERTILHFHLSLEHI